MKRYVRMADLAVALLMLLTVVAWAAPKVQYDPATEVTVKGDIEDVKEFECPVSGTVGFHITLKTADQTYVVHVASARFIKEYEISFVKGDQITVVGSKVKLGSGEEAILAKQIANGQSIFSFRDKNGNPLW